VTLIEMLAAGLLVLASALVFKEILAADRLADKVEPVARPVIRRRRTAPTSPLRKAA
jgi:hypothetical protein